MDGVNPGKMAANFVSLMDLLTHPATRSKKVSRSVDLVYHLSVPGLSTDYEITRTNICQKM
jgi:hypothetical protein